MGGWEHRIKSTPLFFLSERRRVRYFSLDRTPEEHSHINAPAQPPSLYSHRLSRSDSESLIVVVRHEQPARLVPWTTAGATALGE